MHTCCQCTASHSFAYQPCQPCQPCQLCQRHAMHRSSACIALLFSLRRPTVSTLSDSVHGLLHNRGWQVVFQRRQAAAPQRARRGLCSRCTRVDAANKGRAHGLPARAAQHLRQQRGERRKAHLRPNDGCTLWRRSRRHDALEGERHGVAHDNRHGELEAAQQFHGCSGGRREEEERNIRKKKDPETFTKVRSAAPFPTAVVLLGLGSPCKRLAKDVGRWRRAALVANIKGHNGMGCRIRQQERRDGRSKVSKAPPLHRPLTPFPAFKPYTIHAHHKRRPPRKRPAKARRSAATPALAKGLPPILL